MMKMKTKLLFLGTALLTTFFIAACDGKTSTQENAASKPDQAAEKKTILKVGAYAGPYYDLFNAAIKPVLEEKGYKVEAVNFPGMLETDIALAAGGIDFNVSQHTAYMNAFNKKTKGDIVSIIHTPSIPAGIFSTRYKSLTDIKDGAIIAIPLDPSNAARAYSLLAKANWITLKVDADPVFATRKDIVENPHNLEIKEIVMNNIPRILQDVDAAVMPGSIMFSAGFKGKDALILESIAPDFEILVAVQGKDKDAPWVQVIQDAYNDQAFKKYVDEHNADGMWVFPEQ